MSVCLSVLLQKDGQTDFFVTRRYSVETAKRIPKLLLASSRHTAVIVTSQTLRQYSEFRRVPLDGDVECRAPGVWKNRYFRSTSHLILEIIQDVAVVTYCGMRIRIRNHAFEWWYHFHWPWTTLNKFQFQAIVWRWMWQWNIKWHETSQWSSW